MRLQGGWAGIWKLLGGLNFVLSNPFPGQYQQIFQKPGKNFLEVTKYTFRKFLGDPRKGGLS